MSGPNGSNGPNGPTADPWQHLRRVTPARIALGRAGASLPTREVLGFALAHAQARDAVHTPFDSANVAAGIAGLGFETIEVSSAAPDRATYLRRPDLGRQLSEPSRARLAERARAARDHTDRDQAPADLAIIVGDGLSSAAVHTQAVPLLAAFKPWIAQAGWTVAPVVIAAGARVALGDEAAALLKARLAVVLIGERPGLSSPDSLGLYFTFDPRPGRSDADRNCISNIRPEGLGYDLAAFKLAWLIREAFARHLTGVALKDESDLLLSDGRPPVPGIASPIDY